MVLGSVLPMLSQTVDRSRPFSNERRRNPLSPPSLPIRPPPLRRNVNPRRTVPQRGETDSSNSCMQSCVKKYVLLCSICGGLAVLLGSLFIVIYFILRSYTTSLHYFETVPTYVPAVVLILTGFLVLCFIKRKNRFAYLLKLSGAFCLISAVLCVIITITTTVIHMNRLQTFRECVYAQQSSTCTCFAAIPEPNISEEESIARYVFADAPDCEAIHGVLYSCLRALFGLSVIGILVCIFSSMLVYQLLSHERKKMYWEQLDLRRRSFYRQHPQYLYSSCYNMYAYPGSPESMDWPTWSAMDNGYWTSPPLIPPNSEQSNAVQNTSRSPQTEPNRNWSWFTCPRRPTPHSVAQPSTSTVGRSARPMSTYSGVHDDLEICRLFQQRAGIIGSATLNIPRSRRTNEGVIQHLNASTSTYHPPFTTNSSYSPYGQFQNIPSFLWGPPPPYSNPNSIESILSSINSPNRGNRANRSQETAQISSSSRFGSSERSTPFNSPLRGSHLITSCINPNFIGGDEIQGTSSRPTDTRSVKHPRKSISKSHKSNSLKHLSACSPRGNLHALHEATKSSSTIVHLSSIPTETLDNLDNSLSSIQGRYEDNFTAEALANLLKDHKTVVPVKKSSVSSDQSPNCDRNESVNKAGSNRYLTNVPACFSVNISDKTARETSLLNLEQVKDDQQISGVSWGDKSPSSNKESVKAGEIENNYYTLIPEPEEVDESVNKLVTEPSKNSFSVDKDLLPLDNTASLPNINLNLSVITNQICLAGPLFDHPRHISRLLYRDRSCLPAGSYTSTALTLRPDQKYESELQPSDVNGNISRSETQLEQTTRPTARVSRKHPLRKVLSQDNTYCDKMILQLNPEQETKDIINRSPSRPLKEMVNSRRLFDELCSQSSDWLKQCNLDTHKKACEEPSLDLSIKGDVANQEFLLNSTKSVNV